MIQRIQLYTTSTCQLKCEFCPRSDDNFKSPEISMSMETFSSYVDDAIKAGVRIFELSPLIGEALFDKYLFDRISYLNSRPEVELIFFFTNMLKLDKKAILKLNEFSKFGLKLSVYGSTREQYQKRTGVDAFEKMLESMKCIIEYKPRVIEIDLRYDILPTSAEDVRFRTLSQILFSRCDKIDICSEDVNWATGLLQVESTLNDPPVDRSHEVPKGKACPFLLEDIGIWPDGDIGICSSWFDINKKMILGNLKKESASEILHRINIYKKEQEEGLFRSLCSICTYPLRGVTDES